MILWRLEYMDDDHGRCVEWYGKLMDAVVNDSRLRGRGHDTKLNKVDVPTDKAGLIKWLNINLTRDNG